MSAGFVLIHDDKYAAEAEALSRSLVIEKFRFDALADGALQAMPDALIYIDLRNLTKVQQFRAKIGAAPPATRRWAFFVATGLEFRIWQVQAGTLGATMFLNRLNLKRQLRGLFTVGGRAPRSDEATAALKTAPGGVSILSAGDELARLFSRLSLGERLRAERLEVVGADILSDVRAVGVEQWLNTVRRHHEDTFQHCLLVAGTVAGYVERHVVDPAEGSRLMIAAMLHDIGKAAVPLHVLDKPGKLTPEEFAAVKMHPVVAYDYLVRQDGIDAKVLEAVRHHHEALDGSGYPDGITGEAITAMTRALTVCDIFAALVEARAYKKPIPPTEAITMLVKMALDGKVDYGMVHNLAVTFGMDPPETLAEVEENLRTGRHAIARHPGPRTAASAA